MSLGFIGAVGDGFSLPLLLTIMGKTVNNIGNGPSSPGFMHAIDQNSLRLVYLAIGILVVSFFEGYCWTRTGERQASSMRARYLKAVLRQDVGFFDLKFASTNEVITSVSSDSLVIQDVLSEKVPNFIMNFSTFFGSYIAGFILLWRLTAVTLPTVVLLLIPGLIYGKVLLGLARKIQIEYDKAGVVAEQAFSSIRTVYAFTAERRTMAGFSAALENSVRLGLQQGFAKGLALGSNGITFSIWAFMLWYSSRLVMYHGAEGGTVFAVGACIIMGGLAFGASLSNVKYFGEAMAAAERIAKVIERRPPIDSESGEGEEMGRVEGTVEFRRVRFAYPARQETEVLKGFNLRVEAGKTVALVGGSGSGKSTAIALLQRFYDPAGGEIELDGVDIRRLRLKWLRAQMGLVSQEPALFATTIKENILFGNEVATAEEVVAAAITANAHGFISQLPLGYDTQVEERGVQMSGGQKQRLAIARAIVRSPKILLLDEATNALDFKSEHIVQEALDAAAVGRTTIVIAHRLSTIRNADSIAFVQSGQVAEFGSHDELLGDTGGHYAALFRTQQSQPPPLDDQHAPAGASGRLSRSMSRRLSASSSARSAEEERVGADHAKPPVPSLRRLLMMNAPEWRRAAVGCASAALFGGVQPAYSYALGSVIMVFFIKDHGELKEKTRAYALTFVGLTIFSVAVNVLQHYNLGVMGEYLTRRVRERMMSKMLTFEIGWFDQEENSTGALCSRLAKDATLVRSLVGDRMSLLIQALSAVTVACVMGLVIAWRLAVVMIATQPITILCFYAQRVLLTAMSKKAINAQSDSSKLAAEAVGNLRTVTAFSSQDRILRLFHLAQSGPRRQSIKLSWVAGAGLGCSKFLNTCIWALGFWYGGVLVHQRHITSKALLETFMIIASTGRVIADAGSMTTDLAKGAESVASVFSILDRITSIDPDDPDGHRAETISGAVELRGVDFAYPSRPDSPVLCNFSLSIESGRSTALVGSSGSGKSTVIGLIERFYDPLRGVVRIDGRDIRSYNLRSLRRHVALVGQEPTLIASTLRDNITYGVDEASDAEVEAAATAANAGEFIGGLKDGYGTLCGERGVQLSGGQKQRVAIARAILRNPAILLLDEATSALDGQSEKVVQAALERVMVGRTSVVVAHRLNTIRNCDVIAVLHNGVLVEKGSHASLMLMGPSGAYYGLVSLQQGRQPKAH
ncbi:putative multidrug resistance protein [Platanthera zijinensis]|uniref:Multidrug resistance protein n=1 Tax=Platanthera zijinensis TaxID=2320716 RepID=A0AAP0FUY2_9ASPA